MLRMDENDPPGKKRRLQNACDECRRRKIRCDSATAAGNVCSRCLTMKLECTHHLQKRRRGPKVGPREYAARVLVNDILSVSTPYAIPDGTDRVKEILVELANYARSLERQLTLARGLASEVETLPNSVHHFVTENDTLEPGEEQEVEDSIDLLAQELGELSFGTKDDRRYGFGKSSHILLVESAVDAQRDVLGGRALLGHAVFTKLQRPHLWKPFPWQEPVELQTIYFIFPEDDLLWILLELYFTKVNPLFPLLHRPCFERLVADGLHLRDQSFGATLLAVCALASRHSNDPRTLYKQTSSEHGRGWEYFRQIPLMRGSLLHQPSLYDVQLCALYVFYLQGTASPDSAHWLITGVGIRAAQDMGMHRRSINHRNTIENELWKRAFWLLVSMDSIMSVAVGRPRVTNPDIFDDVDLPIECDDEYWSLTDTGELLMQLQGKPSILSFFVTFLKLLNILDLAQRTLYMSKKSEVWSKVGTSRNDWKQNAVIELDSALNDFLDQIPDHLKWAPDIPDVVFFQQSAMLYSMYHWVQIQVHRPFIPRPGRQAVLPFPSLAICSNAARTIIRIVETLEARRDSGISALEMMPNLIISLFSAALILLISIRRPHQTPKALLESEKDMASVYQCLKIVEKYPVTGCMADILNAVIIVGQVARDTTNSRSLGDIIKSQPRPSSLHPQYPESRGGTGNNYTEDHSLQGPALPIYNAAPGGGGVAYSDPVHTVVGTMDTPQILIGTGTDPLPIDNIALVPDHTAPSYSPDPTWFSAPGTSTSQGFTQEDWDSFMTSIDDILATATEYRAP